MTRHEEYIAQLVAMQPPGMGLPTDTDSQWMRLLEALALEPARIDGRAADLEREADPRETFELLEDWERAYGLPDECTRAATSLQERRNALLAKLTDTGRQDIAWYYALAEMLDYQVSIEENRPFTCGHSECGELGPDRLAQESVRYWWNVTVHGPRLVLFRCGESCSPDLLGNFTTAQDLECLMRKYAEAHTWLTFDYLEA